MKILFTFFLTFLLVAALFVVGRRKRFKKAQTVPSAPLTPEQLKRLVGRMGRATGLMIPVGKVDFDGIMADAVLEGQAAAKPGDLVRAIRVDGVRLVVVPANMKVIPAEQV